MHKHRRRLGKRKIFELFHILGVTGVILASRCLSVFLFSLCFILLFTLLFTLLCNIYNVESREHVKNLEHINNVLIWNVNIFRRRDVCRPMS